MDIQKNFCAILALNININLIKQANSAFPFLVFKSIGFHANQILNVLNSHGQTPMKSTQGHSLPYLLTIGFHIEEILKQISAHHALNIQGLQNLFQALGNLGIQIEEIIQVHMNNQMPPQASLLQQSQFFIIQETMMYPTLVPQENSAGLNLLASLLVG
jgi:hypothetical protein